MRKNKIEVIYLQNKQRGVYYAGHGRYQAAYQSRFL